MKHDRATRHASERQELGDDLRITKITPRPTCGGTWVRGTVAGHRFEGLVFEGHAELPEWELGTSRISKLWIQRIADDETVFHFDRGADVDAQDAATREIVELLAEGLAGFATTRGGGA